MKHQRSIDSMIKRWHLKIKYEEVFQKIRDANNGKMKVAVPEESEEEHEPVHESHSEKEALWRHNWSDQDDKKVKLLVVESGILDWDELAKHLETTPDELKLRWKKVIYPALIRNPGDTEQGPKWSLLEDKILSIGEKREIDWENDSRFFLPMRTFGSIKARWRRIKQHYSVKENSRNKYILLRECLRNIARRQRLAEERRGREEHGEKSN